MGFRRALGCGSARLRQMDQMYQRREGGGRISAPQPILPRTNDGQPTLETLESVLGKQPEEHRMDLCLGRRSDPKDDDARVGRRRVAQNVSEVLVIGDKDHRALDGEAQ